MNMHEEEKCFNHYKCCMKHGWVSQPVNSLSGGNQAPISLTQFGMQEFGMQEYSSTILQFLGVFLIFFCPFGANKDFLDLGKNFMLLCVW